MTTQVIFKIDKKLKDKAMKRAQNEGIPFSSILKFATKAFAEGQLNIGLIEAEEFNPQTRRLITKAYKDIEQGKNLSPRFDNAKDAIAYLKSC